MNSFLSLTEIQQLGLSLNCYILAPQFLGLSPTFSSNKLPLNFSANTCLKLNLIALICHCIQPHSKAVERGVYRELAIALLFIAERHKSELYCDCCEKQQWRTGCNTTVLSHHLLLLYSLFLKAHKMIPAKTLQNYVRLPSHNIN